MKTKKLMILGGGEIGRPGTEIETELIDKETIKLTGKISPKLLFLPTASSDHQGYIDVVKKYFGEHLGCKVDSLLLKKQKYSSKEIREKILSSDIVYVGGGNTLKMLKLWRKLGVDEILRQAYDQGVVLSGLSAGGICWFKYGQSDSWKSADPKNPYIRLNGLGLVNAMHAPHFTREQERHSDLKKIMKRTPGVAIALEDCCALEIIDDQYRIIASKPAAKAYKCYWKAGKYYQEQIPKLKEFLELEVLFKK